MGDRRGVLFYDPKQQKKGLLFFLLRLFLLFHLLFPIVISMTTYGHNNSALVMVEGFAILDKTITAKKRSRSTTNTNSNTSTTAVTGNRKRNRGLIFRHNNNSSFPSASLLAVPLTMIKEQCWILRNPQQQELISVFESSKTNSSTSGTITPSTNGKEGGRSTAAAATIPPSATPERSIVQRYYQNWKRFAYVTHPKFSPAATHANREKDTETDVITTTSTTHGTRRSAIIKAITTTLTDSLMMMYHMSKQLALD